MAVDEGTGRSIIARRHRIESRPGKRCLTARAALSIDLEGYSLPGGRHKLTGSDDRG